MAAGFELAVGSAGEDDWNVFGGVGVAIADARAEEDHRVVEDVAFGEALHCLEKVGELGGVPGVDALVLVELFLVAFVRRLVGEAADDGEVLFERFEGTQDGGEFEGFPAAAGSPFIGADAIGHEEAGHADGVTRGGGLSVEGTHCFEEREGEGGASAAKELAAGELPAVGLDVGERSEF